MTQARLSEFEDKTVTNAIVDLFIPDDWEHYKLPLHY